MATSKDFYQLLGLSKGASDAEIKSAYRKLARQYHPDVNKTPEAAAKFKEVSEAYQVLSDPQKKQMYDQYGSAAFGSGSGGFGGAGGFNPFGGDYQTYTYNTGGGNPGAGFGFEDPFELFEQIFGMGGFGNAFRRRATYQMDVSFDEVLKGASKEVEVRDENGRNKRMNIKVPAGVDNGTRVRFGEVDIIFRVQWNNKFVRDGANVVTESVVSVPQIVLGDTVEVETVWGKVSLKVPTGTDPGTLIRIKEKGLPHLRGAGKGDHFVRIKLDVPKKLSVEEKKLYEQLAGIKHKKGWF